MRKKGVLKNQSKSKDNKKTLINKNGAKKQLSARKAKKARVSSDEDDLSSDEEE